MYRLASLMVAGVVVVAGLSVYAEPPANPGDDPPELLKKKGQPEADDPIPPPPAADDKDKVKDKEKDKKPDADKAAEPNAPREDAEEVLKRVDKSMHSVEERLANKEVNDGTRQAEEDALKDLDSLIDLTQDPPSQGGKDGKDNQANPDKASSGKPDPSRTASSKSGSSSSSSGSSSRPGNGKKSRSGRGNRGKGSQQPGGSGASPGDAQSPGGDQPAQQSNHSDAKSPTGGNGGGKDAPPAKDPNADLYKDVWGHLPETLRAEMNAYSNTKGFMPEYEALISKYYSTIAEQGRRKDKGD